MTNIEQKKTWLLTWNPKVFSLGGDGNSDYSLDITVGETVEWLCHSKSVQPGDQVYLIRLGVEPKGIIAFGEVVKAPYLGEDFRDTNKQRTYIEFIAKEVRTSCSSGLLPMQLLKEISPKQKWSAQTSGISIQPSAVSQLQDWWQQGAGVHSLKQLLKWYSEHEFNQNWKARYIEVTHWVEEVREGRKELDDALLARLWKDHANGVASVKQGIISAKDYKENIDFLYEITKKIIENPTSKKIKDDIFDQWIDRRDSQLFSKLNKAIIHRVYAACAPHSYATMTNTKDCKALLKYLNSAYECAPKANKDWFEVNASLMECLNEADIDKQHWVINNRCLWKIFTQLSEPNASTNVSEETPTVEEERVSYMNSPSQKIPANQILFGPPGTGKTYKTIEAAVDAAEPSFEASTDNYRDSYKEKYNQLVDQGRIRFVTFHQSYGYEEFVEGLRANSDGGAISYDVAPGVFKKLANDAAKYQGGSIGNQSVDFDICWQKIIEPLEDKDSITIQMRRTDFSIFDVNENTIYFEKNSGGREHTLSVGTLKAIFEGRRSYGSGLKSYYRALIDQLNTLSKSISTPVTDRQNFVLVIDEINRGNISKVFGELITLIEPSKRLGEDEALTVKLPYSGDTFGVPNNLYIIGTMNTADRSLAMMDTALRRRFDFVEMMPNAELLDNKTVKGINLTLMLQTMNKRIEHLYDREHTLGHAFFIPVKDTLEETGEDAAFEVLRSVFKNKVLPLLEEYFFEDWEKIRLVLGDNQTGISDLQFINDDSHDNDLEELFGSDYNANGDDPVKYKKNDILKLPTDAFMKIYDAKSVVKSQQSMTNSAPEEHGSEKGQVPEEAGV